MVVYAGYVRPFRLPFWVALFLLAAASSRPQSAPPAPDAPPHAANDVVMLSLEPLNPRAEHGRHVRAGLLGNADPERNAEKHLLEIQMNIVRETAPFGPVLLLAPDEATKNAVFQRCQEFQLCPLFRSDRVRVKVVPHDGVWIRDFGPQIDVSGDSASVVHWRYFDIRKEEAKQEKLQELETARLKLLETRQQEDQPDDFSQESTPDAHKTIVSAIDAKIYLLREYSQILSEASPQRFNDENSAFDIADAVLAAPDFIYKSSNVAVDGGNLLKLEDGRCLTTRVLLSRNKDQNINLDQELENIGGCQAVTYLDPLPGPVIEHVDMFALPIGGKRILLASYDLTKPFATEYWSALSDAERDLALNAGLAMELDAERLRALGYEVIPVPSPFPRIPANGHIYYPTVLNALVRASADGYQQLLLPAYQEYETDLQAAARKQIAEAFGPRTTLVPIEATEAAKSQGAIHCLTLTAPLRLSIFSDSADVSRRAAYLARKEQLDRTLAADIASQIPATGLQGSWAILEEDERAEQTPLGLYPQKIFFGKTEFQKGVFDHLESRGTYVIDKRDLTSWSLQLLFPDQDLTRATVEWLSKDEVQLRLEDADTAIVLKRVAADLASPFKTEEPAAASAADAARKHPRRKTPKPAN